MSSQADTIAALQSLQKISAISKKRGDRAIFVTSSVIEALAHLRSRSSDSIEQAQRAIATARSFQLEEVTSEIPQVLLLVCVIDLACSLTIANISQLKTQLDTLKTMLDQTSGNNNPSETGSFLIPINSRAGSETSNLGGSNIVIAGTDGRLYLKFSWLPSADIYSLACFLSGVTWTHQTSSGHQAERFLREGLTRIAESTTTVCRNPTSLPTLSSQFLWRKSLECHMKIHFILILSLRTEWNSARKLIQELKTIVDAIGPSLSPSIHSFFLYIGGVIYQGNGELENALAVFENPVLREISSGNYGDSMFRCLNDLSTLSAMNSALILRDPAHPEHARWGPLLSSLDPICSNHPNKNIQIAYNLIRASPHTDDENISTVKQKVFLTRALNGAKEVANTQLTCITINFMRFKFFNKTVGEQAEKSSLAGLTQAKKLGDRLWVSVAGGMMASTLEVQGKPDEAQRAIEESLRIAARNPPLLQREMEEECDVP
ncbi:MAG: hypothetical protein M1829_006489 [Trizodia sp. TS-e1964]|nr:MAG: hypothetical protein M1829_006489 [Trizodia sp. TS-e1964]